MTHSLWAKSSFQLVDDHYERIWIVCLCIEHRSNVDEKRRIFFVTSERSWGESLAREHRAVRAVKIRQLKVFFAQIVEVKLLSNCRVSDTLLKRAPAPHFLLPSRSRRLVAYLFHIYSKLVYLRSLRECDVSRTFYKPRE